MFFVIINCLGDKTGNDAAGLADKKILTGELPFYYTMV
jgi:hypothetical protein